MSRAWPKIAILAVTLNACAQPVAHDLQSSGMAAFDESSYITSQHESLFSEWPVARSSFSVKEGVMITAKISWRDPAPQGGEHDVYWRVLQGDKIPKAQHVVDTFGAKPAVLLSHLSANSFPPGEYHVTLMIDHAPFGEIPIRLDAVPQQKTPSDFTVGPDCSGGPKDSIRPISRLRPNFPLAAAERNLGGCALVAVMLGEDGHPADVKVLAEHPDHAGFGDALAETGWNTLYPTNHAGEVSFLRTTYNVRK